MASFPWYDAVNSTNLQQGDIFVGCPVLLPNWDTDVWESGTYRLRAEAHKHDVVIITQSCDLTHGKAEHALVCPIESIDTFLAREYPDVNAKGHRKFSEAIRRGHMHGYHMVNACTIPGHECGIRVVSFRQVYSVPVDLLLHISSQSERLRLLPPYREHLGQAFARYFMRVGLPVDIPRQD